jgi:hypothetical protein
MQKYTAFFVVLFLLAVSACQQQQNKQEETLQTEEISDDKLWENAVIEPDTTPLTTKIIALRDTALVAWDSLMHYEDDKLLSIKVVIRDLPNIEGFKDQRSIDKIASLHKMLEAARYNKDNLADSKNLDKYDRALEEVETLVSTLAAQMPELERYPVQRDAVNFIIAGKNTDFIVRQRYNSKATEYNQLLEANKSELSAAGEPYATLVPLPVFVYEPEN